MIVRLAPNGEIPPSTLDEIEQTLQGLFGDNVEVEFEFLDEIPVLPSEKHRYAISELNEP
jgi:hypothetical protein